MGNCFSQQRAIELETNHALTLVNHQARLREIIAEVAAYDIYAEPITTSSMPLTTEQERIIRYYQFVEFKREIEQFEKHQYPHSNLIYHTERMFRAYSSCMCLLKLSSRARFHLLKAYFLDLFLELEAKLDHPNPVKFHLQTENLKEAFLFCCSAMMLESRRIEFW